MGAIGIRRRLVGVGLAVAVVIGAAACGSTRAVPLGKGLGGGGPTWDTAGTGGAGTAIAWAESFLHGQPNFVFSASYKDMCLAFVANAYGAQSTPWPTAWDMAKASRLNDPGNPAAAPRGALMFFGPNQYNSYDGHVGISLGGGVMISANVPGPGVGPYVVEIYPTPSVQASSYWRNLYRGWVWPPASWGPLAVQARSAASGAAGATSPAPAGPSPVQGGSSGSSLQPAGGSSGLQPAGGSALQPASGTSGLQGGSGTNNGAGGGAEPSPSPPTQPPPPPTTQPPPPPPPTYAETVGGNTHTWTNYSDAGGSEGPTIPAYTTVQVTCKVTGFKVADGDTWWYRIAQSPWSNVYYASADAFYNNGQTTGSLIGTPFVDSSVPTC